MLEFTPRTRSNNFTTMDNWKTLMIFKYPREAEEAQKILKLNGINTLLDVIFMTETYELYHLISCEKLMVNDENFKTGIQILRKAGYFQVKELIDGSYREVDLSDKSSKE